VSLSILLCVHKISARQQRYAVVNLHVRSVRELAKYSSRYIFTSGAAKSHALIDHAVDLDHVDTLLALTLGAAQLLTATELAMTC